MTILRGCRWSIITIPSTHEFDGRGCCESEPLRNPTPPKRQKLSSSLSQTPNKIHSPQHQQTQKDLRKQSGETKRELRKAPARKNVFSFLFVVGDGASVLRSSSAPGETVSYISKSVCLFWFWGGRVRCSRRPDVEFPGNHFLFTGACRRFHFSNSVFAEA